MDTHVYWYRKWFQDQFPLGFGSTPTTYQSTRTRKAKLAPTPESSSCGTYIEHMTPFYRRISGVECFSSSNFSFSSMLVHSPCAGGVAHPRTTTSTVKPPIGDYCSFGNCNTNLLTVSLGTRNRNDITETSSPNSHGILAGLNFKLYFQTHKICTHKNRN